MRSGMADPLYVETVDRSGLERGQRALLPKRDSGLRAAMSRASSSA